MDWHDQNNEYAHLCCWKILLYMAAHEQKLVLANPMLFTNINSKSRVAITIDMMKQNNMYMNVSMYE